MAKAPAINPETGDFAQCPPKRLSNGRWNIDYTRWRLSRLTDAMDKSIAESGKVPAYIESARNQLIAEAKYGGCTEEDIESARGQEHTNRDTVERLVKGGLFEIDDQRLKALEVLMDQADDYVEQAAEETAEQAEQQGQGLGREVEVKDGKASDVAKRKRLPKGSGSPKAWAALIRRLLRVRERAREPVPKWTPTQKKRLIEAAYPLRFMAYVGRSNIPDFPCDAGEGERFFRFGPHHGYMALGVYLAREQLDIAPRGSSASIKFVHLCAYDEAIINMPPGHGKTEFAAHYWASWICRRPMTQLLAGHAQGGKASDNQKYIASCFKLENSNGRRCRSLFPDLKLAKRDNTAKSMRLELSSTVKEATIWGGGITANISGGNASDIWLDDPVDQSEIHQAAERERTHLRIEGTWMARGRGKAFKMITATIWHAEDAVNRRIQMAADGVAKIKVVKMPAGGPDSTPPFKPVWPLLYDANFLRARYNAIRDPVLYACIYMCDPRTAQRRVIRQVRLYDIQSPEHQRFLKGAMRHLSLDPAATRSAKSDPAGVLYCAQGSVESVTIDGGRQITSREDRLRILDAQQFRANQLELAMFAADFCQRNPVDYVHIESRSGLSATADFFEERYEVDAIRHDPKNKSKDERLRAAAPLIDDSSASVGIRAVVEFPGKLNEQGQLVPLPEILWVINQILEFGNCADDHVVDALTQLVNHLAPDLATDGVGLVTSTIVPTQQDRDKAFLERWLEEAGREADQEARKLNHSIEPWSGFMDD